MKSPRPRHHPFARRSSEFDPSRPGDPAEPRRAFAPLVQSALLAVGASLMLGACSDKGDGPGPPPPPEETPFARASTCGECHPQHFEEWKTSMHAYGGVDPVMVAMEARAQAEAGSAFANECFACHAPTATRENTRSLEALEEGVSCDVCHSIQDIPPEASIGFLAELDPEGPKVAAMSAPIPNDAHASLVRPFFATSVMCAPCHQVNFPDGRGLENTHREWVASNLSGMGIECQDCHMPNYTGRAAVDGPVRENLHRHSFVGVDYAYDPFRGIDLAAQKEATRNLLANSVTMQLQNVPGVASAGGSIDFDVVVTNDLTGHSVPSGVSFARQMWLEVVLKDADGVTLFSSGELEPSGDLPSVTVDPSLATFGAVATDAQGQPTPFNFRAVAIDESRMIPFRESRTTHYSIPSLPSPLAGPLDLQVRLRFRPISPAMARELDLERLLPIEIFEMNSAGAPIPTAP